MAWEDEINKDVREVDAVVSVFFKWPAATGLIYACVPDKFTREVSVSDDGNPEQIDLSLRARVELFPNHTFPVSGQLIRFPVAEDGTNLPDSKDYRVRRTRSKQFATLWVDCIDENV
jgi:hypothetical protein